MDYWQAWGILKAARYFDINPKNLTFDELIEDIKSAQLKQKTKYNDMKGK